MAKASSSASPDHSHSDESGNQGGGDRDNSNVREQDRFLPIANIGRIMKKNLPAQAKITKDSKETVQECVSELISFITGEANAKCQREKRKTVNGDDLLWAMSNTGFDNYVEPLKLYLHKYREIEGGKGLGMNTPGDQAFGKREGGGLPLSPGLQMGLGGASGGGIPDMPNMTPRVQMGPGGVYGGGMPSIQPDRYQMQMSQQMLEGRGNRNL